MHQLGGAHLDPGLEPGRQRPEVSFSLVLCRHVAHHTDKHQRGTAWVAYYRDGLLHPDSVARFMQVALFEDVSVALPGDEAFDIGDFRVEVVGVGDVMEPHRFKFFGRVTGDLTKPRVDPRQLAGEVDVGDADCCVLEYRTEELVRGLQVRLGFALCR